MLMPKNVNNDVSKDSPMVLFFSFIKSYASYFCLGFFNRLLFLFCFVFFICLYSLFPKVLMRWTPRFGPVP